MIVVLCAAGCGESDDPARSAGSAIPASLRTVESGAEDTTDFILAGKRREAVRSANALDRAARGQAATDLSAAGVAPAQIRALKRRAARVAKLAPRGKPIDVALAANRAFELVPDLFGSYRDPVPPAVTRLDYFDFEAKLEALAGDRDKVARAVSGLDRVWEALREDVLAAGGSAPADRFDAHLRRMHSLVTSRAGVRRLTREAQHGLELVDQLEAVYAD